MIGQNVTVRAKEGHPSPPPRISVIIPVRNGASVLPRCLQSLAKSQDISLETIVVDDGSTDESLAVARSWGVRVLQAGSHSSGPGQARNLGAQAANAPLLCFLDCDVLVRPDTLSNFVALFDDDPELTAAFGSYDSNPGAPGLLSQYRNLLHHFVHQTGRESASTFWSGCGVIRRHDFLAVGGFDPRYTRASIEDIDLGYRLSAMGARIRLAKSIQVTHLKKWSLWGILKTDIRDRALPWTALIRRTGHLPNDLNLNNSSRISALSVFALLALAVAGVLQPLAWTAIWVPILILLGCNQDLYTFFRREKGWWFLLRVLPMHWLYYAYSALAFGGGMALGSLGDRVRRPRVMASPKSTVGVRQIAE